MGDTTLHAEATIVRTWEEDGAAYLRHGPNTQVTKLTIDEAVARYGRERIVDQLRKLADNVEAGGRE